MVLPRTRVPSLWMAGFGVVSGVLSDFSLSLPVPYPLSLMDGPVYPGLIFGAAVALGLYLFGKTGWWRALLALAFAAIAWFAAFRGCVGVYDALAVDWMAGGAPLLDEGGSIDPAEALRLKDTLKANLLPLIASLVAGGGIGAGGTALGAAVVVPALRHPMAWLSTACIGAFCAVGLFTADALIGSPRGFEFMGLFVVWQGLVAASIGYGLRGVAAQPFP